MKAIKIFLITLICSQSILFSQIKSTDKSSTDKSNALKSLDISMPKMDLTNFDDILKQIEPNATTGLIYNDQMLEGAVDVNKYIVGPNDIFALGIWGILNQALPISVSPEGSLIIPSVGEVNVNGLTLNEAKQKVIEKVKRRFISANISLTLISPRRFTITVSGVGQGSYPTSAILRASSVIAFIYSDSVSLMKSGTSPSERGRFSLRNITLTRKSGQVTKIDLIKYYATRDDKYNPYLVEGDVLNLPKYDWEAKFIAVHGAVQFPGIYEYIEGDDLETAIQLVRGGTTMANLDSIILSRSDPDGNNMRNEIVSYSENKNMKMKPNDRLNIMGYQENRRDFRVYVLGEITEPGYYPISFNTTKISDVIGMARGFTRYSYLPTSELFRRVDTFSVQVNNRDSMETFFTQRLNDVIANKDERESFEQDFKFKFGRVNVDFEKAYRGDLINDITLQNGDVIFIGTNKKQVYVYGQVNKPGFVPLKEGADVDYYVEFAGGYSDRAAEDETRVIKFKTREWKEPDETSIQSNDFVYVPKKIKRDFAYDIDLIAKISSVIASVVTLALLIIQAQK